MNTKEKNSCDYCHYITSKIVNDKTGIFDEVYYNFIFKLISLINQKIIDLNISSILKNKDKVLISIGKGFKEQLISLLEKTLISELYLNKENLKGNTPEERYDYFVNTYMKNNMDEVFKESSIISNLVELNINNTVDAANEFFERFKKDVKDIENKFNLNIDSIEDISMSCGDTHNNGRTVFLVYLNNGEKVLYKPHTLKNDCILENVIEFINKKKIIKYPLKAAISLDCGDYGWQKFIKFKECKSEEEVKGYMYRLGELIGLSYILKTNDLHFENIIANGEYPIIIDSETLSYNASFYRNGLVNKYGGIIKIMSDSVYSSVLLPQNLEYNPKKLELSAIAGGYVDQTYTINTVTNKGTDEIKFNYKEVTLNDTQDIKNVVTINGQKAAVVDYVDDIVEGFRDYYITFLDNKKEVLEFISIDENFEGEFRQVLRATALYVKYLGVSYHPYYTINNETREKVFNCLNPKNVSFENQEELIKAEKIQLKQDDVPYFYAKYNSLGLYTHTAGVIPNFYDKTIKEILMEKVNNISKEDLEKQELLIRYSLCGIKSNTEETNNIKRVKEFRDIDISNKNIYTLLLSSMDDYLNRLYSISSDENKLYSYFNLSYSEDEYLVGTLKPVLYEGMGVALYYIYLWNYTKDEKYKDLAERILNAFNAYNEELEKQDIGVFSGLASLIYANYNAYKVFKDKKYYDKYKSVMGKLSNKNLSDMNVFDVTGGLSGIIIMLLNIYKTDIKEDVALKLSLKYGEELLKKIDGVKSEMNTGFAHGLAGGAAALIMLAHFSGEDKYYEKGIELINIENEYYFEEENNWLDLREEDKVSGVHWCYGAAGILVSRLLISEYVENDIKHIIDIDINRCITKIVSAGLSKDMLHNLCHGSIGNLDILLEACKRTNDSKLYDLVLNKSEEICKDIIENGLNVSNPVACINIDFMTGLSGVMYFLLRFINKEVPSILFLESIKKEGV